MKQGMLCYKAEFGKKKLHRAQRQGQRKRRRLSFGCTSQIQTKLDEGPENSSVEEEEQGVGSPERILFKTLHVFSNLLPPAPPACVP